MSSILALSALRRSGHGSCVACIHPDLSLDFSLTGSNTLHSSVDFTEAMCSFNGHVHGGVLAFVLDEAVTCLLLSMGRYAVTGELNIRFKKSVSPGQTAHVSVRWEQGYGRLSKVVARIHQSGGLCVVARASMMEEDLAAD